MLPAVRTACLSLLLGLGPLLAMTGCATLAMRPPGRTPLPNPLPVRAANQELLWERTVEVLHRYHFTLDREDRVAGVIETNPRVGSSLFEPWHRDSIGFYNRLESSLQSIRRRVIITLIPTDFSGGYQLSVQALKEREDVAGVAVKSPGGSTFLASQPLVVDLDPVVGLTAPPGYLPLGRDYALEQALLHSLQAELNR